MRRATNSFPRTKYQECEQCSHPSATGPTTVLLLELLVLRGRVLLQRKGAPGTMRRSKELSSQNGCCYTRMMNLVERLTPQIDVAHADNPNKLRTNAKILLEKLKRPDAGATGTAVLQKLLSSVIARCVVLGDGLGQYECAESPA
ncbi:hypothetical protein SEMRO_1900_G304231.1 [Seminavis robusta]|uniref:Uncharacterized protein n=1 Tax=Seminavis robusta TaxID=568900 RepID=A0A9N8ETE9_9STRA|nr:hypothetical protein SEMRO_1900_G304231.1 [Seminavis robusta]|eukprot:Sro1900_g304231.1  (145) ;mRNA; f:4090-4524